MIARGCEEAELWGERLLMVTGFLFKSMKMHWSEKLVMVAQLCNYIKTHQLYTLKG